WRNSFAASPRVPLVRFPRAMDGGRSACDCSRRYGAGGQLDRKLCMALVKRGDLLTLLGWQRLFPTELMRGQLKVRLAIAWGMALAMRFEEALQAVAEIERDVAEESLSEAEAFRCECQTITATAVALKDDSQNALSLAEACLEHSVDPWTANVASNVARFGHWQAGNLKGFYGTPWIPFALDEAKWNVFASVYRLCLQGL